VNLAFGNAAALALGTATANDAALLNSYQMMGSHRWPPSFAERAATLAFGVRFLSR
jgi:hypothetical protein